MSKLQGQGNREEPDSIVQLLSGWYNLAVQTGSYSLLIAGFRAAAARQAVNIKPMLARLQGAMGLMT